MRVGSFKRYLLWILIMPLERSLMRKGGKLRARPLRPVMRRFFGKRRASA